MSRAGLCVLLALSAGCAVDGTLEGPTPGLHRMLEQPRYDPYEASGFFEDGMAMRPPPAGVVPFGAEEASAAPPLDRALLERGHHRFEIFCAPCHGVGGEADTPVGRDMALRPPPSLHDESIVALSDEELHARIGAGFGLMPSYAAQLPARDRWAVVAYVRALQLARRVPVAWLASGARRALERGEP
ncbi:MAG: cytochrome c [Sandaracinaceae bacterium]|nr:cytochrome c [Sandaracinaceae bacterium]